MKKIAVLLLAIFLGAPLLVGQQDTVVEEIVARVNNNIVSRADLRHAREQLIADLNQQNPAGAAAEEKEREKDLLRDLIDQQLLLQKGQELGVNVDTEVVKRLDELRKQMHADSMEDLEKAAQAQGISFEDFKQNMKNSLITQKVIGQEVGGHISVSRQEVQQFYEHHQAEMERPEQVRLSEILISTQTAPPVKNEKGKEVLPEPPSPEVIAQAQAKADLIYAQLKKGAKFSELAEQNSEGPTAANGGDLEYFKRGTLSAALEQKVFAMKPGEFTEPVRTNQGFVILEVTEHQAAGVPPLKDIENRIQEQVYMTKMQPALREYLTKLREEAYIDIKAGYVDTGASPNETKPVYTTAASDTSASKNKKKKKLGLF
ncbi:MAG: peptidylprolyl isomerase [Acidobacteriota bacterium]|nr:peptidylprolyl isomerase [Acidobacteriota bacterium]